MPSITSAQSTGKMATEATLKAIRRFTERAEGDAEILERIHRQLSFLTRTDLRKGEGNDK